MPTADTVETATTPPRSVRVPNELWWAAKYLSEVRRETLSDLINATLAQYVLDGMNDPDDELTDIDRKKLRDLIPEKEVRRIIRRRTP